MRRLLLFLVLVVNCFGQASLIITKGELNGLWWRSASELEKVAFLAGTDSGRTLVALWFLDGQPVCVEQATRSKGKQGTRGELEQEVDKFYETAANVPLPISIAVIHIMMRLNGSTKEQLEIFRAAALKTYVQ
jgi:hypothetical protein